MLCLFSTCFGKLGTVGSHATSFNWVRSVGDFDALSTDSRCSTPSARSWASPQFVRYTMSRAEVRRSQAEGVKTIGGHDPNSRRGCCVPPEAIATAWLVLLKICSRVEWGRSISVASALAYRPASEARVPG